VNTIKFVESRFRRWLVALQNHRVAAALMVEPFMEAAKTVARPLTPGAAGAVAPHYLSMGWFSMDSWTQRIRNHPPLPDRDSKGCRLGERAPQRVGADFAASHEASTRKS